MELRRHLTFQEILQLLDASTFGLHGVRNYCMVLMAFRHGFRISELLNVRLCDLDLMERHIHVRRLKNGFSTFHPLGEDEFEALQKWLVKRSEYTPRKMSTLFLSNRGKSLSRQQAYVIIRKCGFRAGIPLNAYPHMLRHSCGYALANEGNDTRLIQDYLGHRNIRHTVRYTASNAGRFKGVWERENKG